MFVVYTEDIAQSVRGRARSAWDQRSLYQDKYEVVPCNKYRLDRRELDNRRDWAPPSAKKKACYFLVKKEVSFRSSISNGKLNPLSM